MKTQTAVEWLIQNIVEDQTIKSKSMSEWIKIFDNAKEMEKEQIIQAYYQNGWNDNDNEHNADDYYNETYK
jgi:hypothetical protein